MVFDTTTMAADEVKGLHRFLQGKVGVRVVSRDGLIFFEEEEEDDEVS